jgi:hypothetical protein
MTRTIERLRKAIGLVGLTAVLFTAPCGNEPLRSAAQPTSQAATQRAEMTKESVYADYEILIKDLTASVNDAATIAKEVSVLAEELALVSQSNEEKRTLVFPRAAVTNSETGAYLESDLCVRIEGEKGNMGIVGTDLRSVDNVCADGLNFIDQYSFRSMIARGTASNTLFYLTKEGKTQIKKFRLEDELNKAISQKIKRKTARKVASNFRFKETEEFSVIDGSFDRLLLIEPPTEHECFYHAIISTDEKHSPYAKRELKKGKPQSCPPLPSEEERKKYEDMIIEPIFRTDKSGSKYTAAGIGIKFDSSSLDYDLVGAIPLELLVNSNPRENPINENDLRAMALWGDAPFEIYCTHRAMAQIEGNKYLKSRVGLVFSRTLFSLPVKQPNIVTEKAGSLARGILENLFTEQRNNKPLYFFPPKIAPCTHEYSSTEKLPE